MYIIHVWYLTMYIPDIICVSLLVFILFNSTSRCWYPSVCFVAVCCLTFCNDLVISLFSLFLSPPIMLCRVFVSFVLTVQAVFISTTLLQCVFHGYVCWCVVSSDIVWVIITYYMPISLSLALKEESSITTFFLPVTI